MKQTIDIELLKKNPQLFFSQLPKQAEKEFQNLLEFIFFKYNIVINYKEEEEKSKKELKDENNFLDFIVNNKIKLPDNYKFNRDEANER